MPFTSHARSIASSACCAPQNCNFTGCGAYTGEMAADQMVDMGIEWVLMGHSERRGEFGLPSEDVDDLNALMISMEEECVVYPGERPLRDPVR